MLEKAQYPVAISYTISCLPLNSFRVNKNFLKQVKIEINLVSWSTWELHNYCWTLENNTPSIVPARVAFGKILSIDQRCRQFGCCNPPVSTAAHLRKLCSRCIMLRYVKAQEKWIGRDWEAVYTFSKIVWPNGSIWKS